MRAHTVCGTLFLTTLMVANSAIAQSEDAVKATVVKCTTTDGHVTLTDTPCPPDSATAKIDAPAVAVTGHYKAPATPVQHKAWVKIPTPPRSSPDVATLKAARETMLMAQSGRQQRLAGLN